MDSSTFKIYNASAGSGKTFTLVKEYLKLLIKSDSLFKFKQVLAITFTNKAVSEMKSRVLEMLKSFSDEAILKKPNQMFNLIVEELKMEPKKVHRKSKLILETIINNYAAFDISTIDGFTHKIIRTFAHDLKLPQNFEVELDTDSLLNKAVDNLIAKTGKDKGLTKVLVDFALEKTDDDKSWDISYDLNKIAKLLIKENHVDHLENLENKTLEDFKNLKNNILKKSKVLENKIQSKAKDILNLLDTNNLEYHDFSRSTLPNHFEQAAKLNLKNLYSNKLEENLVNGSNIYTKTLSLDKAKAIDALLPHIKLAFLEIKQLVHEYKLLNNIHKNITPLSVLNLINRELDAIKADENLLLISEFNTIISNEIKLQPVPFIYERIGEKFKHYFIDEFQDTSEMQWQNLTPLLENALTSEYSGNEKGSLLLVGDAKQAIYRWRGGKAEQFVNLFTKKELAFSVKQDVENLPKNYRSTKEIVSFNNSFFKHISNFVFQNTDYAKIFSKCHQDTSTDFNGYVDLTFLDFNKVEDKAEIYSQKVFETIQNIIKNGFQFKDICILVRKRKEGIAIADKLINSNIPIISSETLLLKNSPEVSFIINLMLLAIQPNNLEVKIKLLTYLADKNSVENRHDFYKNHIQLNPNQLFKYYNFEFHIFNQLNLYDAVEYAIRAFGINNDSNAYIQFFLDEVLTYSQKYQADFSGFIDFWEANMDNLNIISPSGQNAVQIMTIHKAKGLEFPVVIFPFAELSIYDDKEPKTWFKLPAENFEGFDEFFINLNQDIASLNNYGEAIYETHQSQLELDNVNLLYVALTRPIEQLYIIGKKDINSKKEENLKSYSGLLINYLKTIGYWNPGQTNYSFGDPSREIKKKPKDLNVITQEKFISSHASSHNIKIITNSGYLWDTKQKSAIEKGNLVHFIMANIKTPLDLDFVINDLKVSGAIDFLQEAELKEIIQKLINHEKLKDYFHSDLIIYNERDIISSDGSVLRPDRIVIQSDNQVTVIDYKTGEHDPKHIIQLEQYETVLREMDLKVKNKILVYINDEIEIKEV